MKNKSNHLLLLLIIFITLYCNTEDEIENPQQNNNAIAVYNQAYQENYEEDKIDKILANAKNAYVLIDPFQENIPNSISAIKANGNEVGAYISIGTGETYRNDFQAMQQYLVKTPWGQ